MTLRVPDATRVVAGDGEGGRGGGNDRQRPKSDHRVYERKDAILFW